MTRPPNDWTKLVPRGKLQKYHHLQTNVPVGHEKEYNELGKYLVKNGFVVENNISEVLRACLEICRTTFARFIEEDTPLKLPPGYDVGPNARRNPKFSKENRKNANA